MEEKEIIISVKNLTKDYGKGRGIFDISFDVPKGCVFVQYSQVQRGDSCLYWGKSNVSLKYP